MAGLPARLAAQNGNPKDTTQPKVHGMVHLGISNTLKDVVTYSAQDSMFLDLAEQKIRLYDSAKVDYQEVSLLAHFVEIDLKNNVITAEATKDSLGNYTDKVTLDQGGQVYEGHRIQYNIKSGKGKLLEVNTEQGGGYLIAEAVKKDTSKVIYGYNGQFTTCDLEHPHFAIRAKKMKIIQDDKHGKIVTGPAYLEVADVPTPLGIPFGFFPNKKGRSSGILIPTYGESPTLGFFLKDGGYYWGISDKIDMAVRGDIYSHGSWGAKVFSNYKVRYKYGGNLSLKYSRILTGDIELPNHEVRNDFFINWVHTQDPKFNPSIRFSANVNAGTSTYNTYNANRPNDYLANTFQSNVSWAKTWKFGSLSANLRHSQNTQTHNVDLNIPQLTFAVNRFYPFRPTNSVPKTWYQKAAAKIGVSYVSEYQNNLNIGDSMLTFRQMDYIKKHVRNGIRQTLPVAASFNVLKHFTFTPAFNAAAVTQFRTIRKTWEDSTVVIDTVNGAKTNLTFNASASLSTRIFGMYTLRGTKYSVIRHTLTPSVSFTYMPDFTDPKWGYYKTVQSNTVGGSTDYSIYEGGIYGASPAGKVGAIGVNLLNSLEAKLRQKANDTTSQAQRVSLLDAFNVSFSYNFMAQHFNWSTINSSFRMKMFKLIDVNASATADPYRVNSEGQRIERFVWREGKSLARLTAANLSLGTNLRKGGFTASTNHQSTRGTEQELNMINSNPNGYVDFNIPWTLNINYTLSWQKTFPTDNFTQSIRFAGDVNVTPKWKVGFDSSYDLKRQEFGFTSLNVYRDLHCWELQFNWIPFGLRQSYNITLNVKSAVLQDLRLTRKRDWYDFSAQ